MGSKQFTVLVICVLAAASAKSISEDEENLTVDNNSQNDSSTTEGSINLDMYNSTLTWLSMADTPEERIEELLYNEILERDDITYVYRAVLLHNADHDLIIKRAVNRLLIDGKSEVFDFAKKLLEVNAQSIIRECFPKEFRLIINHNYIKLYNKRDGFKLKLGGGTDSDGDKTVYADPDTKKLTSEWRFAAVWVEGRLYFRIRSMLGGLYMKLSVKTDSDGDYGVYADKTINLPRNLWYIKPVENDGNLLFYIINKEHNAALKLGRTVDSDGDRQAYGDPNLDELTLENFAWEVRNN